tara:strand:- start:173 stop:448 length:276 start_codon:yes stop_codon:yes gene_type:complete
MTVLEIMERANSRDTNLVIAWLKDAVHEIASTQAENIKIDTQTITKNDRTYVLPSDLISLMNVSVFDTEDDQYKRIRRLIDDPVVVEDSSP